MARAYSQDLRDRVIDAVVGALLDRFGPEECAHYFTHAGYAST